MITCKIWANSVVTSTFMWSGIFSPARICICILLVYQWLVTGSGSHIITLFKLWKVFHSANHKLFARSAEPAEAWCAAGAPHRIMASSSWKRKKQNPLAPRVGFDVTKIDPQLHFCTWNFMYRWQGFVSHVRSLTNLATKKKYFLYKRKKFGSCAKPNTSWIK